jgi:NADH dehydrogenase
MLRQTTGTASTSRAQSDTPVRAWLGRRGAGHERLASSESQRRVSEAQYRSLSLVYEAMRLTGRPLKLSVTPLSPLRAAPRLTSPSPKLSTAALSLVRAALRTRAIRRRINSEAWATPDAERALWSGRVAVRRVTETAGRRKKHIPGDPMIYPFVTAIALLVLFVFLALARGAPGRVPMPSKDSGKPRVVVLGGGFAGVYTAAALEVLQRDDFEIILVSKDNHFVFQPLLPEVITGTIGLLDVVSPIRRLLPKTELHVREVESIDLAQQTITTSTGFHPHPHVLAYDHLVLALGTVTDFRGLRGLPEHAFPFKNLTDALNLRNHVIRALEEAAIEQRDGELRKRLLTFVVAGGGFSGVEVCAELNDFVREVGRSYRGIDPREIRVLLVHSQDRILPEMKEKLALFAQRILRKRGVEIVLNARLKAASGEAAILADGTIIETKTLVSTVPASPHPLIEALALPKAKNGRIEVDATLGVKGHGNVWALGDCAVVPAPDGGFAPPTAQHATRQATTAAENIVAKLRGGDLKPFAFTGLGKMGSLGHRSAVAEIFGIPMSGFVAWFLWRTIYLMKIPGWGRRIKVAVSWTLDLFLPPELVQLRLASSVGVTQEHFEPGQEIFHQGDVGDRVYIILSGQVEIIRDDRRLATLTRGEFFGETALLLQAQRNATVRCIEPLDVLALPKREFSVLSANLPELRRSFESKSQERSRADAGAPS